VACIGPITADAARGHDIRVDAEAEEYTIEGLVEVVERLFLQEKGG
jgi:uroporphyrinogen III methyltransferase/synthase